MGVELNDQEFLEVLVKSIVNHPDDVKIQRSTDEMGVFLQLQVAKPDMGIVIGKGGSHASAIKQLVKLAGMKSNLRVSLRIEEPEDK